MTTANDSIYIADTTQDPPSEPQGYMKPVSVRERSSNGDMPPETKGSIFIRGNTSGKATASVNLTELKRRELQALLEKLIS